MPVTRLTLAERIQCIRMYSLYDPTRVQLEWRKKFGTDPPSRKAIVLLNQKFDSTGSVADLSRTGRPKSTAKDDTVVLVENALKEDPTKSIRALSHDLGINKSAVHRIKRQSDKKGTMMQTENRKLREKIQLLEKQIESLENKVTSLVVASATGDNPNSLLPIVLDNNTIVFKPKQDTTHDIGTTGILAEDVPRIQYIDHNDLLTISEQQEETVIKITSTSISNETGSTQIMHLPQDIFRFIQIPIAKSALPEALTNTRTAINYTCDHETFSSNCLMCLNSVLQLQIR